MEKILKIEECGFKLNEDDCHSYEGFQILTDKQTIKLGISHHQSCCEQYGYFMTNDDLDDFEDANIIDIKIVDECLNVKKLEDMDFYQPYLMFVNIETDKGTIQFTAYNEHNGYYGHDAVVISEQLKHETYL
jgi:hypothetical protein